MPSIKSGIAYGPSNLSKMRRCILAAERQECPADYQQCALVTLMEVAEDLSSVETITIPDTSRKYAGFVAPYQSTNGKTCFELKPPTPGRALLNPPRNPKAASLAVREVYVHLSKTQPGTQLAGQKLGKNLGGTKGVDQFQFHGQITQANNHAELAHLGSTECAGLNLRCEWLANLNSKALQWLCGSRNSAHGCSSWNKVMRMKWLTAPFLASNICLEKGA